MTLIEYVPATVATRPLKVRVARPADDHVIWLRGEHDLGTAALLAVKFARAMTRDDDDVVVDLSEVEFMSAATVGILVRTRAALRLQSRALLLRSPSHCAARMLSLCGVASV